MLTDSSSLQTAAQSEVFKSREAVDWCDSTQSHGLHKGTVTQQSAAQRILKGFAPSPIRANEPDESASYPAATRT